MQLLLSQLKYRNGISLVIKQWVSGLDSIINVVPLAGNAAVMVCPFIRLHYTISST